MKKDQIQQLMAELGVPVKQPSDDLVEKSNTESSILFSGTIKHTQTVIAIKQCRVVVSGDASLSQFMQANFRREITLLSRLANVEFVIALLGYAIADNGEPQLIFSWCASGDLFTQMEQNQIPSNMLIPYMLKIANAVCYLHARNMVHLDLKPQNILMIGTRLVLCDFGHARFIDDASETSYNADGYHIRLGTPGYTATELLRNPPSFSPASDVYSLGIIYWEMLVVKYPLYDVKAMVRRQGNLFGEKKSFCERVNDAIIAGARPSFTRVAPPAKYQQQARVLPDIIRACWQGDADKRPTVVVLQNLLTTAIPLSKLPLPAGVECFPINEARRTSEEPLTATDKAVFYSSQQIGSLRTSPLLLKWFVNQHADVIHEATMLQLVAHSDYIVPLLGYCVASFDRPELHPALVFPHLRLNLSSLLVSGIDSAERPLLIADIARCLR